jgi:integrase
VDLLRLREGDLAKGIPVTPKIGRLTFQEASDDVINDYRVNQKRSLDDVERKIKLHLMPFFGWRRMSTITTADVRAYVGQRQADTTLDDGTTKPGAANAQINRELAILKRAFRLAVQAGKLLTMPHVPMLAENNVRTGFFEEDAFTAMRAHLPADLQGLATFAYLTGWRIQSEVLPLTWAQVDRKAQVIRLEPGQTKNGKGRTLPYGELPELADVITTQWAAHETLKKAGQIVPFVFHRAGKPIKNFRKAWDVACTAAGCPGRIPHDLRRTAVRNLVRAGVPEKTAMMITGHVTRSVFDRYDITSEADLQTALGRLSGTGTKKGQSAVFGKTATAARSL